MNKPYKVDELNAFDNLPEDEPTVEEIMALLKKANFEPALISTSVHYEEGRFILNISVGRKNLL